MPVMEGKCALFKEFANVDAFPICIRSKDVDELVRTIYLISGSFGGINLEDISAPRCFCLLYTSGFDHLWSQHIGSGNAEEHVRALQCVSQSSSLMLPVGELSHFSLGGI